MSNDMILKESTTPTVNNNESADNVGQIQNYPVYKDASIEKVVDEMFAAMKDDRINTKRALAADNASKERVQEHNSRVIAACERELKRKDITEDERILILQMMNERAESTADESAASRNYQEKQLEYSHKQPWKVFTGAALVFLLFAGCVVSKRFEARQN